MSIARTCLTAPCRNVTTDPSGRCHHHRTLNPVPARHRDDLRIPAVQKPVPLTLPIPDKVEIERESYRDLAGEERRSVRHHRRDGVTHRDDGPALIVMDENGVVVRETYVSHGAIHRLDGPAEIEYGPEGEVVKAEYVFQGDQFDSAIEVTAQFAKRYRFLRSLGAYTHNPNVTESVRYIASSSFRVFLEEGRPIEQIVEIFEAGVHTVDGLRQVFEGAPPEWVAAYESGASA